MGLDVGEQFVGTEMHRRRFIGLDDACQFLQALQDVGALDARDVAQKVRQEGLVCFFVREIRVHQLVQRAGGAAGVGRRRIMVNQALVQQRQILVDAGVKLLVISGLCKTDAPEQLVEFSQGAVPGIDVSEELDGVDAPHQGVGVRRFHGRIVMVFAHDGQVHGLRIGNTHPRVHVVQQVHVKEQVPGEG